MVDLCILDHYIALGRPIVVVRCPAEWAGVDRDESVGIVGVTVRVNGEIVRVRGIERHLPSRPYQEGELLGLWCVTEQP